MQYPAISVRWVLFNENYTFCFKVFKYNIYTYFIFNEDKTVNYSFQDRQKQYKSKKIELSVEEVLTENESSKIVNEISHNHRESIGQDELKELLIGNITK